MDSQVLWNIELIAKLSTVHKLKGKKNAVKKLTCKSFESSRRSNKSFQFWNWSQWRRNCVFHSQWKPCCCGDPKQSCGCQFCAQIKAMRGPPQPWNIKYMPMSFLISAMHEFRISQRTPTEHPYDTKKTPSKSLKNKWSAPKQYCGCQAQSFYKNIGY